MIFSGERLDGLRFEGDPLADAVIADLVASGQVDEVNAVLAEFRGNDEPIPTNLPASVRHFLIVTDDPPEWTDVERIAGAYEFFLDDGVHVASVLSFGAMVNCYAQPRPSRVLALTHRLDQPHRRLAETAQFVMNMMAPNPFGTGGRFVPTIQKTRLIHAAIRNFLRDLPDWDSARDGVPICQQDLLSAMLTFSVQVIDGMRRLGISVTAKEADDYYYLWRVAGTMLGIRTDAMPDTLAESQRLNATLVEANFESSPEGIELTRGLIELYQDLVPGKAFDGVVPALVRHLVPPTVADMMGVPNSRGWTRVVRTGHRLMRLLERAEDDSRVARIVLDKAGQLLLTASMRTLTNGQSTTLDIPEDLRQHWIARA